MNTNRVKIPIEQLYKEQKNKYPFCDKSILNWLHFRIENYLINKTDKI
jgi:hypothetical protein